MWGPQRSTPTKFGPAGLPLGTPGTASRAGGRTGEYALTIVLPLQEGQPVLGSACAMSPALLSTGLLDDQCGDVPGTGTDQVNAPGGGSLEVAVDGDMESHKAFSGFF